MRNRQAVWVIDICIAKPHSPVWQICSYHVESCTVILIYYLEIHIILLIEKKNDFSGQDISNGNLLTHCHKSQLQSRHRE